MKHNLFLIASLVVILTALCPPAVASTVLVLDAGAKASAYLPQQLVEAKDLLAQLDDGERVAVVRTAPTKTLFDNALGSETRVGLGSVLASVYSSKGGSDLGAALAVAVSLAARGPGPKRIVLFSSGVPQPPRRSAFYGRTLDELLADVSVVPEDTTVTVRLYGTAPLSISRGTVHVLRETPRWSVEPAFARTSTQPSTNVPRVEGEPSRLSFRRFGVWVAAGVVTLFVVIAFGAMAWRRRRLRTAVEQREEEERQMLTPATPLPECDRGSGEELVFVVDTGAGEFHLEDGDTLIAGDRWDAEPYFSAAGACARFLVRGGALTIENVGTGTVAVGTLPLPSGKSRLLPAKYVEVSVGGRILTVVPEVADREAEHSEASGRVLHAEGGLMQ